MPRTAHSASPAAAAHAVEHMTARCADPASSPSLFAGMTAVASTPMARRVRRSVALHRWVHPAARTSSCPPHRLTLARAHCRRLPRLFNHRAEGVGEASFVAEKLSSVRQRSTGSLTTRGTPEEARAAAGGPARAAAAARWPAARPQAPCRPAGPMPAPGSVCMCVSVVGSGVPPLWPLSGRKGHVRGCASCVSRRDKCILSLEWTLLT